MEISSQEKRSPENPGRFTVYATSDQQWEALFKLNVTTMRNVLKAIVPTMIERAKGSIVNIGAMGALTGAAEMGSYCASKSVVMRLTESLSAELKHHGINVNAVLPSIIDTAANRAAMPDADPSNWVAPEDLAHVICFLGSDRSRAIHGALVPVAGLI
jgi:NAD(P)-dependent dehydrogenase (short-subunit alcohol dehydrogenase family)